MRLESLLSGGVFAPWEVTSGLAWSMVACITTLTSLAPALRKPKLSGLCDVILTISLVVAAEEVDLLHPTVAVLGTQMPIQPHDLGIPMA